MNLEYSSGLLHRYLQEYTTLGTAGGLYHFRDQLLSGQPEGFLVFNGDICCKFPLAEMLEFHKTVCGKPHFTMLATEVGWGGVGVWGLGCSEGDTAMFW